MTSLATCLASVYGGHSAQWAKTTHTDIAQARRACTTTMTSATRPHIRGPKVAACGSQRVDGALLHARLGVVLMVAWGFPLC